MVYRPDVASLRSRLLDGCGFGDGTTLVRLVGPWPHPELVPVFGGEAGFHFPQVEEEDVSVR